jgi:hypothetical protein
VGRFASTPLLKHKTEAQEYKGNIQARKNATPKRVLTIRPEKNPHGDSAAPHRICACLHQNASP